MPSEQLDGMRQSPVWAVFEGIAPTLAYDAAVLGLKDRSAPLSRAKGVSMPTLILNGGASFPFMQDTALALAQHIPNAQHRVLEGQTHDVAAEALAPMLKEFLR